MTQPNDHPLLLQ